MEQAKVLTPVPTGALNQTTESTFHEQRGPMGQLGADHRPEPHHPKTRRSKATKRKTTMYIFEGCKV